MKHLKYILLLLLGTNAAKAQNLDSVLNLVEKQNKALKVYQGEADASKMTFKTGLTPENPSVEYEVLFGTPEGAGTQRDLSIIQRVDFPSSYVYKTQASKEKIKQADHIWGAKRQQLLLDVKLDYLQWIYLNQLTANYKQRVEAAEKIYRGYQKRMDAGDGNILDFNKLKLLLLETKSQLKRTEQRQEQLQQLFVNYTGGALINIGGMNYPVNQPLPGFEELDSLIETNDPLLKVYETQKGIAAKETSLNKALALPGLQAGYRSQSILGQQYKGVHIGMSIPLWERKNTVKQKRLEQLSAENRLIDQKLENRQENSVYYKQYQEATYLLNEYKMLLDELKSEQLLAKALEFGEISMIQYYNEILSLYKTRDAYLEYGLQQQQAIARLLKFKL